MAPGYVRRHPRVIGATVAVQRLGRDAERPGPAGHALAAAAGQSRAWQPTTPGGRTGRRNRSAATRCATASRTTTSTGARVPDGQRGADLPAASGRPARRAGRPAMTVEDRAREAVRVLQRDERRGRAGDRDPGAVLMPRADRLAPSCGTSAGLPRTLPSWMDQAACASHDDPDLWFPERGEDDRQQEALRICAGARSVRPAWPTCCRCRCSPASGAAPPRTSAGRV